MDAVVYISERAELRLKHDVLAVLFGFVIKVGQIGDERHQRHAVRLVPFFEGFAGGGSGVVYLFDSQVLPLHDAFEMLKERFFIEELAREDCLFLIFVRVEGRYALFCRAVLLIG